MRSSSSPLTIQMARLFIFACITLLTINGYAFSSANSVFNIGAILDEQSPVGKEQIVAARIAVQSFNSKSRILKLNITFKNSSVGVVSSATAAEELIKENEVKAIIGMNEWIDAATVGEIGSKSNVPVISFSEPAGRFQSTKTQWPFLVTAGSGESEQMMCVSGIIGAYKWKQIVAVYEENLVGGSSGKLALFADNLKAFDAEIEYSVSIPPFFTMSSPRTAIKEALQKLSDVKSRVFVVLQMSLPATALIFNMAKDMGLTEANSVWILANSVANYLDTVNSSVVESMEGALGVKSYYSINSTHYLDFRKQFRERMVMEYPDTETLVPHVNALRAYDVITTIGQALKKSARNFNDSKQLLTTISSADGRIKLRTGQISNGDLRVVNVVGKSYKALDFCLPGNRLSKNSPMAVSFSQNLAIPVIWPGNAQGDPKGWDAPTTTKKMKIVVPGNTVFDGFVKVADAKNNIFEGLCIEIFKKAMNELKYPEDSFVLEARNGTYEELVDLVKNKTYDGLVGDVTLLAERLDKVQFTSTYIDSGLSLISLPVSDTSTWMFVKPFTGRMWALTGAILIYTTLVVWCMERASSPELGDTWREQIGNAVMFTLSSLFFVQRERLHNNLTRVVLIVWLFLVLVLNSSFTASLTAMLAAQKVHPKFTDIKNLVQNNLRVACDRQSFLYEFIQREYKFKTENILDIRSPEDLRTLLENKTIAAAFLETPYKRSFNQLCGRKLAEKTFDFKFGGFAFAFQKGLPIAEEISKKLLGFQVAGKIKKIEDMYLSPSENCVNEKNSVNKSLEIKSFWVLYAISAATSTICLVIFIISKILNRSNHAKIRDTISPE